MSQSSDVEAAIAALSARSWLLHYPGWWPTPDRTMQQLLRELPLRQEHIRPYGKTVPQPRLTAVAGRSMDPASRYRRANPDAPWTTTASTVRDAVAEAVCTVAGGWQPNGLIANLYRRGATDSIGWHADDEPALGVDPVVVSVSFGGTRRMRFKRPGPGPHRPRSRPLGR
ncbi:alpha-ketoglutarate-dependent dioxygenase AlkB [Terrabacter sp. 2RAF25]|uniref:alpha-ketoglutarate-dependent dioxygenase AlkB n=1 Tax=Terrabacter sp. 2RAF25 TaxID=3232998 RepID=UPI003F9C12BA